MRTTLLMIMAAALLPGCARRPVALEDGGTAPQPVGRDILPDWLPALPDGGVSPADAPGAVVDLQPTGRYVDLEYHRSVVLPDANPGCTDAKLAKLALVFTDWGFGKIPAHCQAKLQPTQLSDLLLAAEQVDWTAVNQKMSTCPEGSQNSFHSLWLVLTPAQGQPLGVETTWCDGDPFPPADLASFLQVMEQVEAVVCGF